MLNTRALTIVFCLLTTVAASAATAYEALQTIKATRGDTILNQLVEARGESGQPQPQSWTIMMNDSSARGGIREFVVSGGQILSERTPVRGFGGQRDFPALNFSRLNLDSDGAFDIIEKQATARQLAFNSVDYTLRTDEASGAPLWVIRVYDYMGAPVGRMQISAENGEVVETLTVDPDARAAGAPVPPPSAEDNVPPPPPPVRQQTSSSREPMGGVIGVVERTGRNVGERVKDTTLNVVGTVQEVLTGRRTVGEDDE